MATIIDALVVTLGLDPSKFQKGQKDAQNALKNTRDSATKTAKDMEADGKKAAEFFSKLRNEAIALTAALVGANGVKSFVATMVTGDAALGRMSKNVGMSVESLSAWQQIAERTGGSADGMASSVKNIASQMSQLHAQGFNEFNRFLPQMGINIAKFNDESTTMEDRLMMLGDALHGMKPQDAQFWGSKIGLDEGTINVLSKGRLELEKLRGEQERIGHATKDHAKAAQDLEQAWKKVGQSATNAGRKAYPFLTESANGLAGLIDLTSNGEFGTFAKRAPPDHRQSNWLDGFLPQSWIDYLTTGQTMQPGVRKVSGKVVDESTQTGVAELFSQLESQWGLPAGLLDQVWRQESGRGKNKVGKLLKDGTRAMGDFQLVPKTAAAYGVKDPMDFKQSAPAAAHMLSDLLKHFHGNLPMALAGYNWGVGNVDKFGMANLNPETSGYVRDIMLGGRFGVMGSGGGSTTTVHIDRIEINTKGTDAKAISRDIGPAIRVTMQATSGMN